MQPDSIRERVEQLLRSAREGSGAARGAILEQFRSHLLWLAGEHLDSNLRPKGGASDLVQEAFLNAHQSFDQFEGRTEAELNAWLREILLNLLANFRRRYQFTAKRLVAREVPLACASDEAALGPTEALPHPPECEVITRERALRLEAALTRLDPEARQLVVWRNLEQLPFAEIARREGVTEKCAQKRWARALRELQARLTEPD